MSKKKKEETDTQDIHEEQEKPVDDATDVIEEPAGPDAPEDAAEDAGEQPDADDDREEKIEELTGELAAEKDKYLRLAAEFDNFRKRKAREHDLLTKQAAKNIMEDLLAIVDTFELALDHAKTSDDFDKFHQGIEMLHKQLTDTLSRYGLSRIEAKGKAFDPNFHEAVSMIEAEGTEPHTVIDEMQAGYLLNDMVLRASKVIVSK